MRGSAGINLGNLISGAVVPALNISISPGWLLGAGAGPVMASSWGEREGERGVCVCLYGGAVGGWGCAVARHVLTNRLVQHPDGGSLVSGDDGV